jgi:assimilatory nitrate reductase catalytic subunit
MPYALLESAGPQQWPLPEGGASGAPRLYTDGRFPTADGRARFAAMEYVAPAEASDPAYPLQLNTGRLRDHWHGMSRTGTVARLFNHTPEPVLTMHPADMPSRGLREGDLATVSSRRGELVLRVAAGTDVAPGHVFLPMHWGSGFVAGAGVNALTQPAFDPVSKQPELKSGAVQVIRAELPWQLVAMAAVPEDDAALAAIVRGARACLDRFAYAALTLAGRDLPLVVFQAAAAAPVDEDVLMALDTAFGLEDPERTFAYMDFGRGVSKRARFDGPRIGAVRLAGDTCARTWVQEAMVAGADAEVLRRWVLAPVASPPQARPPRGRIVCNCLDVAESEIGACLASGADLATVQQALKCGTQCGSCLPELKRLVAAQSVMPAEEARSA